MAGTSSAKPSSMDAFLANVSSASSDLTTSVNAAGQATTEFEAAPCDPQFRVGRLGDGVQGAALWTNQIIGDDNFVTGVRNAFVKADAVVGVSATTSPAESIGWRSRVGERGGSAPMGPQPTSRTREAPGTGSRPAQPG